MRDAAVSVAVLPVVIVGAGPYGLSLAAHLSAAGIGFRIFGTPMAFWAAIARGGRERYLKSTSIGTNISVPRPGFSFPQWSRDRGLEDFEPCSMQQFTDYGLWVQQQCVPQLEQRDVAHIRKDGAHFHLTLEDGETLRAARVVLATGLACFDSLPEPFASLPAELCTHTTHVKSFTGFAGKAVAVIGAGQSALEAAALLHEAGARPTLIAREERLRWMNRVPRERPLIQRLRSPLSGLGSGPRAWLLTHVPGAVHHLPDDMRTRFVSNHLPAEGAWWLRARVEGRVEVLTQVGVTSARADGGADGAGCVLGLSDGTQRRFDHVLAGTGFRVDMDRVAFLDPALRGQIARIMGSPRLDAHFETSVEGLHVIGPASAMSFGPLFRFVVGAPHAARTVAGHCQANRGGARIVVPAGAPLRPVAATA